MENTSFSFEVSNKGWVKVPKDDRSKKAKQYFRNTFISSLLFPLVMQTKVGHSFYTKVVAQGTDINTDVIETLISKALSNKYLQVDFDMCIRAECANDFGNC